MRGERAAARARLGQMEGRKSSNRSARKAETVVRNVRRCAANSLNVPRRCGHRSSLRRSLPRESARDAVVGVVAARDAERLVRRQLRARRQLRICVRRNGHRARLGLRVHRKPELKAARRARPKAAHRVPRVMEDRSGEDVFGVAGRAVVMAADRRAGRLLRNRAGLLD